ncbi:MAG: cellulase family glycosylhydrolase [Acetobacteraceae bacterium]|nr:cellulase family glycosylhydrolase [Acetobacteraceae bacterium]
MTFRRFLCSALLLLALLAAAVAPAIAAPPADRLAVLRRGVNITNWFRYPPSLAPAALRGYMGDPAIADLSRAGFTFVRLAVQPEILLAASGDANQQMIALVLEAVQRLEQGGLGVIVEVHPITWHLDTSAADRASLLTVWSALGTALAPLDPHLTFPEIVNEPVFQKNPADWESLQISALATIRAALPQSTVVLTGNQWGGIDGLLRLHPVADPNVIYSFHFYEPTVLTTLGAYQPGLDAAALAALPFPVLNAQACQDIPATEPTRSAIRAYCGQRLNAARVARRISEAAAWGRLNNAVVLAGEFGARDKLNPSARLAWLAAATSGFEARGIGWALWGYEDSFGLAVPRPPGEEPALNEDVLDALMPRPGP